jgi:branched-chain amino acid transport system permease protein
MEIFVQTLVTGILIGGLYVAISIGFTLSFGVLDVVDLAVGMWVVAGVYAAVICQQLLGIEPLLILPIAFIVFGIIGWIIGPFIYRVRTSHYALPALMALAFTFGIETVIRGGLLATFGYTPKTVKSHLLQGVWHYMGISMPVVRVAGFIFALVLTALLLIFLYFTRPGLAIRAMAQNKESAGLMGVNVKRMSTLVYALYVGMTGMAGVLVGAVYATSPQIGLRYTLFAFFVVVLAGLGSVLGVLVSGLILGVLQAFVSVYVGANYTLMTVFLVLFVILLLLPNGLARRTA